MVRQARNHINVCLRRDYVLPCEEGSFFLLVLSGGGLIASSVYCLRVGNFAFFGVRGHGDLLRSVGGLEFLRARVHGYPIDRDRGGDCYQGADGDDLLTRVQVMACLVQPCRLNGSSRGRCVDGRCGRSNEGYFSGQVLEPGEATRCGTELARRVTYGRWCGYVNVLRCYVVVHVFAGRVEWQDGHGYIVFQVGREMCRCFYVVHRFVDGRGGGWRGGHGCRPAKGMFFGQYDEDRRGERPPNFQFRPLRYRQDARTARCAGPPRGGRRVRLPNAVYVLACYPMAWVSTPWRCRHRDAVRRHGAGRVKLPVLRRLFATGVRGAHLARGDVSCRGSIYLR